MKSPGPSGPGSLRRAPGVVRIAMVCALYFACPHRATAQIFELTGGASSMFNAEGGSVEIHAQDYSGRIDLGYLGRPSLGFAFSRPFKTFDLTAGDQQIPFALPTDLFNNSFYFLGRGLSYSQHQGDSRLFVFAGETSDGYFAPFLNVARNDTPAGAIFYEKQLSRPFAISLAPYFPTGRRPFKRSNGRPGKTLRWRSPPASEITNPTGPRAS